MKQYVQNNLKNVLGWKTNRKIVVFSVDDYGNVRLDSKKAREKLDKKGLKATKRFDQFDTLETTEDLSMLFDVLESVRDSIGNPFVFSAFAIPCNINFENMKANAYSTYEYELLPQTFEKLASFQPQAYNNTWEVWKNGMTAGLIQPQSHGREHFNLNAFNSKLENKDYELLLALQNRSFISFGDTGHATVKSSAAFEFWKLSENEQLKDIISDGLNQFEKVFGFRSTHFNPPGGREHPYIHKTLKENGIKYLDTPFVKQEHQGEGKYKRILNWTGKKNKEGQVYCVRNVVFEPTFGPSKGVGNALRQIATAFDWNKPAVISSHRVNFCGHIDPENRKVGLTALKELLDAIVKKWPDVEFMSATQMMEELELENRKLSE